MRGYWVCVYEKINNNLKANIVQPIARQLDQDTTNEVALSANPGATRSVGGIQELKSFQAENAFEYDKVVTSKTMLLLRI